jgi:hypothetical protein
MPLALVCRIAATGMKSFAGNRFAGVLRQQRVNSANKHVAPI